MRRADYGGGVVVRAEVDAGRTTLVIRAGADRPSARIGVRWVVVTGLLLAVAIGIGVVSLGVGDYPMDPLRVLRALGGGATAMEREIVTEWRAPRVVVALVFGALLGMSGAIFQSLTRNVLGSPDIIGFGTGAYTGALVVIVLVGGGAFATSAGALVGGLATAVLIYLLAFRSGVQGFRLVIVGIGVSAMLAALNTWIIMRADLESAMVAATWGAGTLNGIDWRTATPALILAAVQVVPAAWIAYRLPYLELGDDTAQSLGHRVEGTRLGAVVLGVALTATATAVAGPISFVALAAPQLAKRLTRLPGTSLAPAAAMGSLLLVAGDFAAQHAFGAVELPVGVVTSTLGGAYLVWLLSTRAGR
ncbi:FecCD family ABC transporter permease [Gordonia shandongensis]|uniref:FecCD family ABC transporter permease n=1 Tax=Gordonia shandongensis TaxID=376351 RepID=UPI00040E538B|nr:iron chelate uptake ABC transporter family permease subunit [Gordonia shandongensis]